MDALLTEHVILWAHHHAERHALLVILVKLELSREEEREVIPLDTEADIVALHQLSSLEATDLTL